MGVSASIRTERTGGQVRLRGTTMSLPVSVNIEGQGRIKKTLQPNVWTAVPEELYVFLKGRFDGPPRQSRTWDVDANERNPHKPSESATMTTEEVNQQFFLEFRT